MKKISHLGTMNALIGSKGAEHHVKKYLNPEMLKTQTYILVKDFGNRLKAGTVLKLKEIVIEEGKYLARFNEHGWIHWIPLNYIHKPLGVGKTGKNMEAKELQVLKVINDWVDAIRENNVPLWIDGEKIHVSFAEKVERHGQPSKADIVIHSGFGDSWWSLKDGPQKNNRYPFQQYGGVSYIRTWSKIQEFLKRLHNKVSYKTGAKPAIRYTMALDPIDDAGIMYKALFGNNWTCGVNFGPENVNGVIHGIPEIVKSGKKWILKAPIIHLNNRYFDLVETPMNILAWHVNQASFEGFNNTRIGIVPANPYRDWKALWI